MGMFFLNLKLEISFFDLVATAFWTCYSSQFIDRNINQFFIGNCTIHTSVQADFGDFRYLHY